MYILLEIIRYTLFSTIRLLQFNSIPSVPWVPILFLYLIYLLSLSLSLGDIYPPSIISSFDYILLRSFSVVSRRLFSVVNTRILVSSFHLLSEVPQKKKKKEQKKEYVGS